MKKTILAIVAAIAAVFTVATPSKAQSPTPSATVAPIAVPSPTVVAVKQPINVTLSVAQVQQIVTALTAAGINLPSGIQSVSYRAIATGTNAGGAWVQVRFQ